jgi:hypothetical protein
MNRGWRKVYLTALGVTALIVLIGLLLIVSIGLLWPQAPGAPPEAEAWHTVEDVQQYPAGRGLPLYVPPHYPPDEGLLTISAFRARQAFGPDARGVVSIQRVASPGEAAEWAFRRPTKHLQIGSWYFEGDPEMLAAIASRLSCAGGSERGG